MKRTALLVAISLFACSEKNSSVLAQFAARRSANEQVLDASKGPRALRKLDREAVEHFLADAGTRASLIDTLASSCHARVAAQKPLREAIEQSETLSVSCSQAECAEPIEQLYESIVQLKDALRALERDTKEPCAADFAQNFDAYIDRIRAHRRR